MRDDFEISQMFQAAVDEASEAGWSEQRIREELEEALSRAMEG
jgi:hypothetical protein